MRDSSNYSVNEWGARFRLNSDDSFALQQWLASNQPHIAGPGTIYIDNPLICPDGASFQGPPTTAVAEDTSIKPAFVIAVGSIGLSFPGAAMLIMPSGQSCGIHSVGIIAPTGALFDAVDAMGKSDLIDQHCFISGGYYDVKSGSPGPGGGAANLEIYDSALNNAFNIDVLVNSPNAKVLRNSIAGAGTGVPATPVGPFMPTTSGLTAMGALTVNFSALSVAPSPGMTISGSNIDPSAIVITATTTSATMNLPTLGTIPMSSTLTIASPTGENIRFASTDGVMSDNIIQQAAGWGILAKSARSMRANGNFFDNNGKVVAGTGAINVDNSGHITICGNTLAENAAASEAATIAGSTLTPPAHILFSGTDDSVALCGNVYLPLLSSGNNSSGGLNPSSVLLHPDYDYDVAPLSVLSNISINDNPAIQNAGVLTTRAMPFLAGALNPRPTIYGLALSAPSGGPILSIAPGAASDVTNQALITLGTACTINLGTLGSNGLDINSATTNTLYNIFLISGLGGASPTCVASLATSPSVLNFATPPLSIATNGTFVSSFKPDGTPGSQGMVFNIGQSTATNTTSLNRNPLAGMQVGNIVASGGTFATGATIASMLSFAQVGVPVTISNVAGTFFYSNCFFPTFSNSTGTFAIEAGMNVTGTGVPANTYITAAGSTVAGSPNTCAFGKEQIAFSGTISGSTTTLDVGGAFTLYVANSGTAGGTTVASPINFTVKGGLYRQIGTYTYTAP